MRGTFAAILAATLCLAACQGEFGAPEPIVRVRGRVVDAETCASVAGCTGVEGMIVSLANDPEGVVSDETGPDGTFVLDGVPTGYWQDLVVRGGVSAVVRVAPTRNPMVVAPDDEADLFNVELYVLPRDPASLVEGLRREGIDLALAGGYVGQAVRVQDGAVTAADGAGVGFAPPPRALRFVNALPRFLAAEPILLPEGTSATGVFGLFVAEADGAADPVAVVPLQEGFLYDLVVTRLDPGVITYAVHRGTPRE